MKITAIIWHTKKYLLKNYNKINKMYFNNRNNNNYKILNNSSKNNKYNKKINNQYLEALKLIT